MLKLAFRSRNTLRLRHRTIFTEQEPILSPRDVHVSAQDDASGLFLLQFVNAKDAFVKLRAGMLPGIFHAADDQQTAVELVNYVPHDGALVRPSVV
jgi:hypothetical protein